jgi:hypothetical protein
VTLLCLWIGKISMAARRQREAIKWIESNYGTVGFDWEDGFPGFNAERPNRTWLHRTLGDDYFQTVVSVGLRPTRVILTRGMKRIPVPSRPKVRDIDLLRALPDLERLDLRGNAVKDISSLARLRKLTYINLADNRIEDCTPLLALKGLKQIEVQGNPLSAEMIDSLRAAFPDAAMTWSKPQGQ